MQDKAIAPSPAPFLARIAAMVYELLLVTAVLFVASLPFLYLVGNAERGWRHFVFQAYLIGVLFAYFSAFWMRSGQTLAMKTWRIRLVSKNGGGPTRKQTVLRFASAFIGPILAGAAWLWWAHFDRDRQFTHIAIAFIGLLAGSGLWWALLDRDGQFLHDRLAGTRLVRVPRKA